MFSNQQCLEHVPRGYRLERTTYMHVLLEKELPVNIYEHKGLWLDIGRVQDLQSAQDTFEDYRHRITGD